MADTIIEGGGGGGVVKPINHTDHSCLIRLPIIFALEGSSGMLPWDIFKTKASNGAL